MPNKKRERHFKRIIHHLEDKLRKPSTPFMLFEVFSLYFYKNSPELFKEGVSNDLVERAMIKTIAILGSGMQLDMRPNMVQELIHKDNALHKYIAEVK